MVNIKREKKHQDLIIGNGINRNGKSYIFVYNFWIHYYTWSHYGHNVGI